MASLPATGVVGTDAVAAVATEADDSYARALTALRSGTHDLRLSAVARLLGYCVRQPATRA